MSLSSFHFSCRCTRLSEEASHEPACCHKGVRLFAPADMPVVALRMMIIIKNRGHLLTCTNVSEPIPNTFGMASIALNPPQYDLVEIPSFVGPLLPNDQFGRRHPEPLYVAS